MTRDQFIKKAYCYYRRDRRKRIKLAKRVDKAINATLSLYFTMLHKNMDGRYNERLIAMKGAIDKFFRLYAGLTEYINLEETRKKTPVDIGDLNDRIINLAGNKNTLTFV